MIVHQSAQMHAFGLHGFGGAVKINVFSFYSKIHSKIKIDQYLSQNKNKDKNDQMTNRNGPEHPKSERCKGQ